MSDTSSVTSMSGRMPAIDATQVQAPRPARPEVRSEPVSLSRAAVSEWIKFRTLRSSWAILASTVVGMVAIGLILAYNTRQVTPNIAAEDLAPSATMQGFLLGQLLIGSLGVLVVSGEYSTGMIRSTFAAVPKRLPTLWAKGLVFVAVVGVAMVVAVFVTFLSSQALLSHYRTGYSLSDSGVLRAVLGTALYLTAIGLLGGAAGWIVRSTPGALVSFLGLILVLPVLFGNLLGNWGKDVSQFLPSEAGQSFITGLHRSHTLSTGTGLVVFLAWVVAGVASAAVLLRRRNV
ncbi:MAG: putative transporter transrane protein [Mycobacterium sp.]|nr:putative transporter transrane protein [Mycobacterium sp.]